MGSQRHIVTKGWPVTRQSAMIIAIAAPLLGACESSIRLPALGSPFGQSQRVASTPQVAAAPTPHVQAAPLDPPVARQDLPPPPGAQATPRYEPLPVEEAQPAPETRPAFGEPPRQATLEPPKQQTPRTAPRAAEPEAPAPPPTRTSVTGNWSVAEASGGSCRVTLSSTPKLDLYNAGTSGCQSRELQRVTAWELRDEEIYLYESGGAVAARLRASGARRFNGALARTGAPVTLSK
jgi:hypothetical protein